MFGVRLFSLNLVFAEIVCVVVCNKWVLMSASGGTDHHVSVFYPGPSDELRDVP